MPPRDGNFWNIKNSYLSRLAESPSLRRWCCSSTLHLTESSQQRQTSLSASVLLSTYFFGTYFHFILIELYCVWLKCTSDSGQSFPSLFSCLSTSCPTLQAISSYSSCTKESHLIRSKNGKVQMTSGQAFSSRPTMTLFFSNAAVTCVARAAL